MDNGDQKPYRKKRMRLSQRRLSRRKKARDRRKRLREERQQQLELEMAKTEKAELLTLDDMQRHGDFLQCIIKEEPSFQQPETIFLDSTVPENNGHAEEECILPFDPEFDAHFHRQPVIAGRRLVDIDYFLQDMHTKFDNHSPTCPCNFKDLALVNSKYHGTQTEIIMECRRCLYKNSIWSENPGQ
ncbi:uncharacterized protein LOC105698482 [Orussus abietinus]|uniref:uncharacterized protein LOC105695871 n=1 Tax=Orussus abietinus TaxID=222816 RepID=UPI0006253774|nr:uncharacterized protein LOC105695871 [Orussus abietinus]XP_012278197.1 uncharacterized protein LOC105698482 [Orussus abietinus]